MLMTLERHILSLIMSFQCRYVSLSGPGAEVSVHLSIADLNLYSEKEFQEWRGLWASLSRILRLMGQWRAVLKVLWRAVHKLSGVRQGWPKCVIASVGRSFLFLTQFINFQGPQLLFAISWILLSKKDCLVILTVDLKSFHVTNLIQLVSPQPVDWFSQTKLWWKAPNEGYLHICGRYKSNNKQLRYQNISSYKSFIC